MITWAEISRPFSFAPKETPIQLMNRLAQHWAPRLGAKVPEITPEVRARKERWTHEQIDRHITKMAKLCPKMIVRQPPRFDKGPIVLFELADGQIGQLDGRHRCNLWRNRPGEYDVLILELYAHPAGE